MENNNVSLDQLRGVKSEAIPNPNLRKGKVPKTNRPTGKVKPIDPSELLGLKSKAQMDRENPEYAPREEKIFEDMDKAIERKMEEVQKAQDVYDQTEGNITKEDLNDIIGFDPDEMLKHPPRPGKHYTRVPGTKPNNGAEKADNAQPANVEPVRERGKVTIGDLGEPGAASTHPSYVNEKPEDKTEEEILRDIEEEIPEDFEDDIPEEMYEEDVEEEDVNMEEEPVEETTEEEEETDELSEPLNKSDVLDPIPKKKSFIDRSEDDDLKALDDEGSSVTEDENALNDHRLELLKEDINSKISHTSIKSIAGFTISKKPISVNNASIAAKRDHGKVADWVLPGSDRIISMREMTGTEIETLLSNNTGRNKLNGIRDQYQLLYDHVIDPYKPKDVDSWVKLISVTDVDHLYAAVYRATFEGKNFIPYDCPDTNKCKNSFLSDNVPFMDMVKFKDNNARQHFDQIMNSTPTAKYGTYDTTVYPVSDVYALGFKEPSIYDVVFVSAYLDDEFINKYQDIMTIAPYIDGMYYINSEKKELQEIYVKKYPNDVVKSTKAKVITLSKIVKDLTSDQYNLIAMYANDTIKDKSDEISFVIPETHCPKCGAKIEEQTFSASQLLFLRHRLAALANS